MPLNKAVLAAAIKTTFDAARAADPSLTPDQVAQQVADGLANAIDAFVRNGDVGGVQSKLTLDIPNNTGTGAQLGVVHIQ